MKFRTIALSLIAALTVTGCATSAVTPGSADPSDEAVEGSTDVADTGDVTELIWWVFTPSGDVPDDVDEVLAKANEISKEKIGVTAKMIYKTDEQFNLDLQTGEYYDMTFYCDWCNDFDRNAGNGYYYDITDMVKNDTPDLYDAIDPWWEIGTLKGKIYGVPLLKDLGAEVFFRMNSDYFEGEKGLTLPEDMAFEDLEQYLAMWKEDHPGEYPFYMSSGGPSGMFQVHERIVGRYLVIPYSKAGTAEGTKIITVFDDEEYIGMLRNLHKWYELGYINPDAATTEEVPYTIKTPVRTGTAWTGFMGWSDPELSGFNVKLVRFIGPNLSRSTEQGALLAINAAASKENVEACLKYAQLLYTARKFRDTLAYGIEGKHFNYCKDTVIRTEEGNDHYLWDAFVTGPAISASVVSAGEDLIADPDQWKRVYEGYKNAKISDTKGFSFDPTPVEAEIAALDAIWSSYSAELVTGTSDTDEAIKEIRAQMEEAGLETVQKEAQRQLDEYLEQVK